MTTTLSRLKPLITYACSLNRIGGVERASSFTVVEMKEICMEECHKWLVPCVLLLGFGNAKVRLSKVVTMCWRVVTGNMHFC